MRTFRLFHGMGLLVSTARPDHVPLRVCDGVFVFGKIRIHHATNGRCRASPGRQSVCHTFALTWEFALWDDWGGRGHNQNSTEP